MFTQFPIATTTDIEAFAQGIQEVTRGPRFASVKIDGANLERVLSSRDGQFTVTRIRGALGLGRSNIEVIARVWCTATGSLTFGKVSAYSRA